MKITAEIQKFEQGLLIANYEEFITEEIDLNKRYTIEIKPYKSKRSLEQNKTAWLMIEKISEVTQNNKWVIYREALKNANQEPEFILALPDAEKSLKQVYRVVEALDETREINGKSLTIFKCWIGSSKLDTLHFSKFIDYLMRLCSEYGIYIELDN